MSTSTPYRSPGRSRLTNGRSLHLRDDDLDGRSVEARRWRDLYEQHWRAAGADKASPAQISRCRRLASLTLLLDELDARIASGEPVRPDEYAKCTGQLERTTRAYERALPQTMFVAGRVVDAPAGVPLLEAYCAAANKADAEGGQDDDEHQDDDSDEVEEEGEGMAAAPAVSRADTRRRRRLREEDEDAA